KPIARRMVETVDAIIDVPDEAVGGVFWIFLIAVIRCDFDFLIAFAIAIGVAAEPEFGGFSDQNAAVHSGQRAGHDQVVEKNGALIHAAIVVGVFEDNDSTGDLSFALAIDVRHEAAHFKHPEAAIGIKR